MKLSELGPLGEKISEGAGECLFVCKLDSYPGWLYKAYRAGTSAESASRLDRLIGLPGQMPTRDKLFVDEHTSWPSARVVDLANQTTGVLLPMAPEAYKSDMALPGGRSKRKYLEVDLLALDGASQRRRGLPPQSLANRISVCASVAAAADLLERHGLVYLDWSYANVFWGLADHSAYLIDMDGISFGPRLQIQSQLWDDPYVPMRTTAGNATDRFRVALLITSCLTGKRVHDAQARTELSELRKQSAEVERLAELLLLTLNAAPASRPTIARMKAALDAAGGASRTGLVSGGTTASTTVGGVVGWKPINKPAATRTGYSPQRSSVPANTGAGSPVGGTGPRLQSPQAPQPYRAQPPATPSSNAALLWALGVIAVVVIVIILAL